MEHQLQETTTNIKNNYVSLHIHHHFNANCSLVYSFLPPFAFSSFSSFVLVWRGRFLHFISQKVLPVSTTMKFALLISVLVASCLGWVWSDEGLPRRSDRMKRYPHLAHSPFREAKSNTNMNRANFCHRLVQSTIIICRSRSKSPFPESFAVRKHSSTV